MPNSPNDPENKSKIEEIISPAGAARPQNILDITGKKLHEVSGDITNRVVATVAHTDLAQKFSDPINGALAREYIKGRSILEERQAQGRGSNDLTGLSSEEQGAVRAYQKVHSDLPAQIPFIDRDALVREVERHIEIKAKVPPAPTPTHEKAPAPQAKSTLRSTPASSPSQSGTKELSRASAAAVPKETSIKPPNTPASKDTSHKATDASQLPRMSDNTSAISSNKDASLRSAPPRPNEPQARELKSQPASGSGESVTAPKNVPPPGVPARGESRESHVEAANLNKESSRALTDTPHILPKIAPNQPEFRTSQTSQTERLAVPIRRQESKTVQLVTAIQALPFGRRFGQVEILTTIKPSQKPQSQADEQTSKSTADVRPMKIYSGQSHSTSESKPTNDSKKTIAGETTGDSIPAGDVRTMGSKRPLSSSTTDGAHTEGVTHVVADSRIGAESSAGKQSHRDAQPTTHAQSHSISEGHSNSESHTNTESHTSTESHSSTESHAGTESHTNSDSDASNETRHSDASLDTGGGGHSTEIPSSHGTHGANEQHGIGETLAEEENQQEKGLRDRGDSAASAKTYVVKGLMPEKRYITGGELAFVTIMALASASRVRPGENAAEHGLIQSRREFVLVEEESWIEPEYTLPSGKTMPSKHTRKNSLLDGKTEEEETHNEMQRGQVTQDQISQRQKATNQRKVLLRPQIMVQEGDNLSQMAEALFNDSRYGHLIADLNSKTIDDSYVQKTRIVRLTTRQRLSLPVYQDISQFDAIRLGEIGDMPLMTIVESTAIDKELLNEGLSPMLGINSKNRDPLERDEK
jgi:hypothetical protein